MQPETVVHYPPFADNPNAKPPQSLAGITIDSLISQESMIHSDGKFAYTFFKSFVLNSYSLFFSLFRKGGKGKAGRSTATHSGSTLKTWSQQKKGAQALPYNPSLFTEPSVFTGSISQSLDEDGFSDRLFPL